MLRSSSIPTLGALIAEGDHRHDHCSPLLSAHRISVFGMSLSTIQMRRARSETDLHGLLCVANATQHQNAGETANNHIHQRSLQKLSIVEESDHPPLTGQVRPTLVEEEDLHSRSRVCSGMGSSPLCGYGRDHVAEIESIGPFLMAGEVTASSRVDDSLANFEGGLGGREGNGGGYGGHSGGLSGSSHGDADLTDLRYRTLLRSDPQNPLLLRNYAHYLSEMKHDYKKSEEYYERAILACPGDGEVLSTYAKHVWDVHKDSERADSYFNQAIKATPDDCYVLASYASFLWQCDENEEVDEAPLQPIFHGLPFLMASAK